MTQPFLNRRKFTMAAGAVISSFAWPARVSIAKLPSDKKLIVILNRGGSDGLSLLAPTADPGYDALRGLFLEQALTGRIIGSFFHLHPKLATAAGLFDSGEALIAHATGLMNPTRSHFDAQNLLESGGKLPYAEKNGFLNRMLGLFPDKASGLAMSRVVPVAMRGDNPVSSYAPSNIRPDNGDLYQRISRLYDHDERLHQTWETGVATRALGDGVMDTLDEGKNVLGALTARLILQGHGRVAMVETLGWDTHSNQIGQLNQRVSKLDALLLALRQDLESIWRDVMILVVSEFGRTAAINGTRGTDHGTGSVSMVFGGGLAKTGLIADWPGLKSAQLYEGRDLKTTLSLESFISSAIAAHYGLDVHYTAQTLYPNNTPTRPEQW